MHMPEMNVKHHFCWWRVTDALIASCAQQGRPPSINQPDSVSFIILTFSPIHRNVSFRSMGKSVPLPQHPDPLQADEPPAPTPHAINICNLPRQQPALHLLCLQCHSHQPQELHGTLAGNSPNPCVGNGPCAGNSPCPGNGPCAVSGPSAGSSLCAVRSDCGSLHASSK